MSLHGFMVNTTGDNYFMINEIHISVYLLKFFPIFIRLWLQDKSFALMQNK